MSYKYFPLGEHSLSPSELADVSYLISKISEAYGESCVQYASTKALYASRRSMHNNLSTDEVELYEQRCGMQAYVVQAKIATTNTAVTYWVL